MSWPPTLAELKADRGIDPDDTRDDDELTSVLDAAVAFVESVRPRINYRDDPLSDYPAPGADLRLGTLRLAGRWHIRRRSPDGLVEMAELGASRIPAFDPDIEKLLRIGRWSKAVIA